MKSKDKRNLLKQGFLLIIMAVLFHSCTNEKDEDPTEKIVKTYCGSCHLTTAADMLDSITWAKHVLPAMALKLGIRTWSDNQYYPGEDSKISMDNWMKIVEYYSAQSPKKLTHSVAPVPLKKDWSIFECRVPLTDTLVKAATTMVAFNAYDKMIYTSSKAGDLVEWDQDLKPHIVQHLPGPAVNVFFEYENGNNKGVFTCIGTIEPNDRPLGKLMRIGLDTAAKQIETIIADLNRPVQSIPGDFNQDGLTDWLVCAFGFNKGGFYLSEQIAGGQFKTTPIHELPGTIQATVGDFNRDGWPDIISLFAQADEGIVLYLNDRKGGFTSRKLLEFPPVYGSTSFQLIDLNKDGNLDIVYTSGDNADYSRILKPYHGIYIFMNEGDFHFKQSYFYPINGCYKAMATDFDQDGDLDIAAIAYFPDWESNPSESFIYFEQEGSLNFIPHSIPVNTYGRWICMEVSDCDSDGDPDIILGNYADNIINQPGLVTTWDMHIPFIILQNKTKP